MTFSNRRRSEFLALRAAHVPALHLFRPQFRHELAKLESSAVCPRRGGENRLASVPSCPSRSSDSPREEDIDPHCHWYRLFRNRESRNPILRFEQGYV